MGGGISKLLTTFAIKSMNFYEYIEFMKTKKALILSMALALSSLGAWAGDPGVTILFTNGKTVTLAMASDPKIAIGSDCMTVSSSRAAAISYQFNDVQRFYFEDDAIETGIQQAEGPVSTQRPVVKYVDGTVTVSGMAAGERLSVVTADGSAVATARAGSAGNASIDLSAASAGVYVVSTGSGISFKLLKK